MISVLFSWIIILFLALTFGYCFLNYFYFRNDGITKCNIDEYIMTGLLLLTVYAQAFSLFYKVGTFACFILFCLSIYLTARIVFPKRASINKINRTFFVNSPLKICLFIVIILSFAIWTSSRATFYDTSLYHAQAIEWIEEYGVVKGLGNFHNRFAYNSAFLPLQALFSFKWALGNSLHTMNGFVCCCAVLYALFTNRILLGKKISLADFMKISIIIYAFFQKDSISSPNTDMMPMILVWYIFVKWSEYVEEGKKCTEKYALLCVFCAFAISLKLSCAMLIFLSIYPIIIFVKERKWFLFIKNLIIGIGVIIPWLIRNVMISGYLLYPYANIDLFDVDWKMPKSILENDSKEIIVWGRSVKDVTQYSQPITKWLPIWFMSQSIGFQIIIVITAVAIVFSTLYLFKKVVNQHKICEGVLIGDILLCIAGWMLTSPLLRYGMMYMFIVISVFIYVILRSDYVRKMIVGIIIIPIMSLFINICFEKNSETILIQGGYENYDTEAVCLDGAIVYIPSGDDDRTGYYSFPSTGQAGILNVIELRGDNFSSGFKVKQEYLGVDIKANGE